MQMMIRERLELFAIRRSKGSIVAVVCGGGKRTVSEYQLHDRACQVRYKSAPRHHGKREVCLGLRLLE